MLSLWRARLVNLRLPIIKVSLVLAVISCGLFAVAHHVFAATDYDITAVGNITMFKMYKENPGTTELTPAMPLLPFVYEQVVGQLALSGVINDMSVLTDGDRVAIELEHAPDSTYKINSLSLPNELADNYGVVQFTVASAGNVVTLTKTAAPSTGLLNFEINASRTILKLNNPSSTSSEISVDGNVVKFRNETRPNQTCTAFGQGAPFLSNVNSLELFMQQYLCPVYNDVLAGLDETALKTKYGNQLTDEMYSIIVIEPNPQISSVAIRFQGTGLSVYDIREGVTGLNYFRTQFISTGPAQVNITPSVNMSSVNQNAIFAQLAGQYSYGVVENGDGSWVIAVNFGRLIGDGYVTYPPPTLADSVNMPASSPAARIIGQTLIDRAIQMKLAAPMFEVHFTVSFYDPVAQDTIKYTKYNSVFGDTVLNPQSWSPPFTASDEPQTNQAAGQTAIKVNYVDVNGNPVATVDNHYGCPVGASLCGAPTPDMSITPKDLSANQLTLVTNPAELSTFEINNGLSAGQAYGSTTTVAFPTSGTTEIYYVYVQACSANPALAATDPQCDTGNPKIPGVPNTGVLTSSAVSAGVGVGLAALAAFVIALARRRKRVGF